MKLILAYQIRGIFRLSAVARTAPNIMAEEYIANISGAAPFSLEAIGKQLSQSGLYEIEEMSSEEIKLRYSGQPRRDSWPEDVTISWHEGGLLVSAHAGSTQQVQSLLRNVRSAVTKYCGYDADFDEV